MLPKRLPERLSQMRIYPTGLRGAREQLPFLCHRTCLRDTWAEVRMLNQKLHGWTNYFCLGTLVRVYDVVQKHVRRRLRRWLCLKHKVRTRAYARFPNEYLHDQLGLVRLDATKRRLPWATA